MPYKPKSEDELLEEFENGRSNAKTFSSLVYGGIVIAATTLFINFVLTAFPASAYMSRFIMFLSGILVGASMIAFPYALHNWVVDKTHRKITVILYYLEMAVVALNTVVSFAVLLFKNAGAPLPEWITWYEPFSILSIIYTLAAWGTVFLMDPEYKVMNERRDTQLEFKRRVSARLREALDLQEGQTAVDEAVVAALNQIRANQEAVQTGKTQARGLGKPLARPVAARPAHKDEPVITYPPEATKTHTPLGSYSPYLEDDPFRGNGNGNGY